MNLFENMTRYKADFGSGDGQWTQRVKGELGGLPCVEAAAQAIEFLKDQRFVGPEAAAALQEITYEYLLGDLEVKHGPGNLEITEDQAKDLYTLLYGGDEK